MICHTCHLSISPMEMNDHSKTHEESKPRRFISNAHIKMRGWDEENRLLFSWEELLEADGFMLLQALNGNDIQLQRWTGLTDSEGREIYEADVVHYGKFTLPANVEWTEDLAQWSVYTRIYHGEEPDDFTGLAENIDPDVEITVIGNIMEDEDLEQ